MRVSTALYCASSAVLASWLVFQSLYSLDRGNFLSRLVQQMSNSNTKLLIGGNTLIGITMLIIYTTQKIVFDTSRTVEIEKMTNKLVEYGVMKFVLLYSLLDYDVRELAIHVLWFCFQGVLRAFTILSKERIDYINGMNPLPRPTKILFLAISILLLNTLLLITTVYLFGSTGFSVITLLSGESFILYFELARVFLGYFFRQTVDDSENDNVSHYFFFADKGCSLISNVLTMFQLLYCGISFTILDFFLIVFIRHTYYLTNKDVSTIIYYSRAIFSLDQRFEDVSQQDLKDLDDVCAICRDKMTSAKKLKCGHIYHKSCLQSLLQHQPYCPICRTPIPIVDAPAPPRAGAGGEEDADGDIDIGELVPRRRSFLASLLRNREPTAVEVQRIQEVVPHVSPEEIIQAFSRAGSVRRTIDLLVQLD